MPGNQFGAESPWIVDSATILSKRHVSVTILIKSGEVYRKDIELSFETSRPILALYSSALLWFPSFELTFARLAKIAQNWGFASSLIITNYPIFAWSVIAKDVPQFMQNLSFGLLAWP